MTISKPKLALLIAVVVVLAGNAAFYFGTRVPSAARFVAAGAMLSCTKPDGTVANVLGKSLHDDKATIIDLSGRVVSFVGMPCQAIELSAAELAEAQKPAPPPAVAATAAPPATEALPSEPKKEEATK